ncbi:MAG: hypothetical protein A4E71_03087 [Smithella sp. PtaU1.Bin162]|nr:MAG: hypothetical protein A4E71_03087 [Smithella sp. PtaU1.Bin162]
MHKLRSLMFQYRVTYKQIATELKCKPSTVRVVACGKANSQRIRQAFADKLHCEVADLWPGKSSQ